MQTRTLENVKSMLEKNKIEFIKEIQQKEEEQKEDGMKKIQKDFDQLKEKIKEFNKQE